MVNEVIGAVAGGRLLNAPVCIGVGQEAVTINDERCSSDGFAKMEVGGEFAVLRWKQVAETDSGAYQVATPYDSMHEISASLALGADLDNTLQLGRLS